MCPRLPGSARPLTVLLVIALALLACNLPQKLATATPAPALTLSPVPQAAATAVPAATIPPVITHVRHPAVPGGAAEFLTDISSAGTASQQRAPGGEDYNLDRFERPFTSKDMKYLPWVDISRAELAWDGQWFYISIKLQASPLTAPDQPTDYMAEVDVNRDGRGDYLILAAAPKSRDWTTDGVRIYEDKNHDVGGATPLVSDTQPGDGYETLVFDQGQGPDPDAAWARISPSDPSTVQLAFLPDSIGGSRSFIWWAWADRGAQHPDWFDYNDHFTQAQAGSPLVELKQYYPLAELWGVDNTCRMAYGFTPTGSEKGLCQLPAPTPPPGATGTPRPTASPTFYLG